MCTPRPFMTSLSRGSNIIALCERDGPTTCLSRKALRTGEVVCDLDRFPAFRAKIQGAASVVAHSHALIILDARLAAG